MAYTFPRGVVVPPTVAAPLPDVTSVVVRTPLIPQSSSAADPRLVYTPPMVPRTEGLTPSYLPNQGGQVYMPYSSTSSFDASNAMPGEGGTTLTEPGATPAPSASAATGGGGSVPRIPQIVLLPAPTSAPKPFYASPTNWLVACAVVLVVLVALLAARLGTGVARTP